MKKLYALLAILIILYIGINVGANGLNILSAPADDVANDTTSGVDNSTFPQLSNFTDKKINDTFVSYRNSAMGMTINLSMIDNQGDIADIATNAYSNSDVFTSNQTIDQNGVPVYLLYSEGSESYGANIYFNKDNQNYMITGSGISYEDSDYFINHCKELIDSISGSSDSGFSRW